MFPLIYIITKQHNCYNTILNHVKPKINVTNSLQKFEICLICNILDVEII